ncbi:MAG: iron-containing alcohol dehydrogenase, partial [Anaerolineales bacterium]|nr:iron-containing alcohol dehydrogenase [Anaerolineales bacterium]
QVVFGEGALSYLAQIHGARAYIITDAQMVKLGFVDLVTEQLAQANIEARVFDQVEPEPSLDTVRRGAALLREYEPDWVIGLGGGSPMDAAKAMWALYECPDLQPDCINPLEYLGLGKKARLIEIATTSGTGSEVTWATVLSDPAENRKLGLGSRETLATIAIVDPVFAIKMPPRLTADTGLDALTHAIEGYTSSWHNDFSDGMCLKAVDLVFKFLPKAYANGNDTEAREKMHNAAAIAGLGFINSLAALAHAMGHSFGGAFHVPHGRAVSLFLPYTMEFAANGGNYRYADLARFIGLDGLNAEQLTRQFIAAVRDLEIGLQSHMNLASLNIAREDFVRAMPTLLDHAENDTSITANSRVPERAELEKVFWYAYDGKAIDF